MRQVISIVVLFITFFSPVIASDYSAQELGECLFAVHATDIFPENGIALAGFGLDDELPENFPNFRCTIHFAIGELVRPIDDWIDWEEKKYAIVTPLCRLYPQLVNLNCYDAFILGDFEFDEKTILVAPVGTNKEGIPFAIFEYDENTSLREAVDALIFTLGGWKVEMLDEDLEDQYPPAMIGDIKGSYKNNFYKSLDKTLS